MELENISNEINVKKRTGNQAEYEPNKKQRIEYRNKKLLTQLVVENRIIIKCILSNLSIRDLQRMSRVSKLWNSVVEDVEYERNNINHLFFIFQGKSRKANRELEGSIDHFRFEHSFIGRQLQELKQYLQNSIKELTIRPRFGFLFHGNFQYLTNKSDETLLHDLYLKQLPKDCDLICVTTTHGIIGTPDDYNNPVEIQSDVCQFAGISYLLLPQLAANVHIDTFSSISQLQCYMQNELFKEKKLKCLLLFSRMCGNGKLAIFRCVENILNVYDKKLALGGIVAESVRDYASTNSLHKLMGHRVSGVLFAGDQICAASLVIKPHLVSEIEQLIKQFRQSLDFDPDLKNSRKTTLAFMFVCYGRGFAMHEQVNIETDLIHKHFPNIRLVGVFGSGEYGNDYWPNEYQSASEEHRKRNNYQLSYQHAYSSVLVLVQITRR